MIEKRGFIVQDKDTPDKNLKNGSVREIRNMTHREGGFGMSDKLELIPGMIEKVATVDLGPEGGGIVDLLPSAGTNKCIGAIESEEDRVIYYFINNTVEQGPELGGDIILDGIYEYEGRTDTITKIIETGLFGFTGESVVMGAFLDGHLVFTDANEVPYYINVPAAKAGKYQDTINKQGVKYKRPQPQGLCTASKITGGNSAKITHDSYKFAFQLVYFDGGVSRMSHFSDLIWAVPQPSFTVNQFIRVQGFVTEFLHVDKVRLFYQKNNDGNFYMFKELVTDGAVVQFSYDFDGSEAAILFPSSSFTQFQENIPLSTKDFAVKNNRFFLTSGKTGHVDDSDGVSLTASAIYGQFNFPAAKMGGIYNFGVVWEDNDGWKSPVRHVTSVNVPYREVVANLSIPQTHRIEVTINGTAPSWAVQQILVVSRELEYEQYMQCPSYMMFVAGKETTDSPPGGQAALNGWNYYAGTPGTVTAVHLKLPSNLPFYPEKGQFLKFIDDEMIAGGYGKEAVITDVVGDKVFIDNLGTFDWNTVSANLVRTVEIYSKNKLNDDIFYEVAKMKSVASDPNPTFVFGDTWTMGTASIFGFSFVFENEDSIAASAESSIFGLNFPQAIDDYVESPSPAIGSPTGSTVATTFGVAPQFDSTGVMSLYTFDYTKIDNDRSLPHTVGLIEELIRKDVVLYSDPYIQDTQINGLFNVGAFSEEVLGAEDGSIIRLEDVGQQVLLAVHENAATSLYVGQGVLRTFDDQDIITKEDAIIGYTRRLKGRWGTRNPESLAVYNDRVYYWDAYRGDVVRYAQDGLTPLAQNSDYKSEMERIVKARIGLDYKAYGAYLPEMEEYFLSFPDVIVDNVVVAPRVTLRYSERYKGFDAVFDFYPDFGHKIGSKLIFWSSGRLFGWMGGANFRFFDSTYIPKVVMVFNGMPDLVKMAQYFLVNSTHAWRLDIKGQRGAASYIMENEWLEREPDNFYSTVYRDINSLGALPDPGDSRMTGDTIRGESFEVTLTMLTAPDEKVILDDVALKFQVLSGQVTQPKAEAATDRS